MIGTPIAADAIVDRIFSGDEMSNIQSQVQNRQLELRERANNVTVVGDNTEESNITSGSGQVNDASALMVVPSSNSDNPYILNSYMQYNVVM